MAKPAKKDELGKGLLLGDVAKFKSDCRTAVREPGSLNHLQIKEFTEGYAERKWFIQDVQESLEVDGKPSFALGSNLKSHRCTLSFDLKNHGKQLYLEQLFLHVYKIPVPKQGSSTMLVRAEWDFREPTVKRHAQPHWHVQLEQRQDPQAVDVFGDDDGSEAPDETFEGFEESSKMSSGPHPAWRLHLAMAATWHVEKGGQHSVVLNSERECSQWLSAMTRYLRDQITYSESKT